MRTAIASGMCRVRPSCPQEADLEKPAYHIDAARDVFVQLRQNKF